MRPQTPQILEINSKNFNATVKQHPFIILNFTASWCGPCMLMADVLEKFVASHDKVTIGKVNVDTNLKLTKQFKVKGVPQFLLIKNESEIKRHIGPMTMHQLEQFYQIDNLEPPLT